ncbi:hypothetical protein K7472_10805 [Streptomyces sp. PTM05]|uniref:Uncharacterized protein n=1 Tax=Streptantibioticus parmotrematis TaxID=2873249 RepID=A0ABS7QQ60_9ACTN|nr:hypothetical protein [Streptantibioticus parmotrematis]MBY8885335.1 hypothetical protein [Streptantibioticus parmotrematis]
MGGTRAEREGQGREDGVDRVAEASAPGGGDMVRRRVALRGHAPGGQGVVGADGGEPWTPGRADFVACAPGLHARASAVLASIA